MSPRIGAVTTILAAALPLAGCGGDDEPAGGPDSGPPTSTTATATATATSAPWQPLAGALGRCGPQPPDVADAGFVPTVLKDPEVGRISAATAGTGPTVAVLLHQTDGNGLCGWLPYAADLVAEPGVQVLAVDLCRYGESECRGDRSGPRQVDAVGVAVREARSQLGATRVVVVGASMGGSVALMTAASVPGVDAAVDLSGPVDWDGLAEVVDGGRALRVPVLVAMADAEGVEKVDGSRAIVENAPQGSRFEPAESGHGYDLLLDEDAGPLPLAASVAAWIRG
ncbi:alpha/beta hydrolase [Nocardioides daeguensis]|uniref:AB hydrolase-1 domain-containing protein n=1 Tax=Nocardioides daeguensis TaxID=908359 RepID=A0ABP6VEB5_9ACTN|nr:alpha/beta fold hydrolase [Nocardioides daeguensis]MBV6729480.1 alpha/beta fold hydrolase [Nocardioides daeguensis]MCR1771747.1 alpha/beta fold hydrolase [Nocardioides daeguensis]